jgi:hypothetical protein
MMAHGTALIHHRRTSILRVGRSGTGRRSIPISLSGPLIEVCKQLLYAVNRLLRASSDAHPQAGCVLPLRRPARGGSAAVWERRREVRERPSYRLCEAVVENDW